MVDPFLADVAASGIDLVIVCTYRSLEDQAVEYAKGRTSPGEISTWAKPGQSAHNFRYAIDICPIAHGKLIWDETNPIWQELGNFGRARGLEWYGAPNAKFHEDGHFQQPNWRDLL